MFNCTVCESLSIQIRAAQSAGTRVGIGRYPVYVQQAEIDRVGSLMERHDREHEIADERRHLAFEARMRAEGRVERWDDEEREYVWSLPGTF